MVYISIRASISHEVAILAKLNHPHIVNYLGSFYEEESDPKRFHMISL